MRNSVDGIMSMQVVCGTGQAGHDSGLPKTELKITSSPQPTLSQGIAEEERFRALSPSIADVERSRWISWQPGRTRRNSMMMAALCAMVAGCSTFQPSTPDPAVAQRLADVTAVAGAPVSSFRYMRMSSYEPIGLRDLLVFTTPREAWLLHLDGQCRDLDWGPFLGLTSTMNRVSSGFDSVRVRGNPIPCRIEQIRPVDTAVLKRVDRERAAPVDQSVPAPMPAKN